MTRKITTILLTLIISANFSSGQDLNIQEKLYSVDDLKKDLYFLKTKLENNHPNLYLYTQKSLINNTFDSIENSIDKPLSATEFYKRITIISSLIKDGHTIILPNSEVTNQSGNVFLPYHFVIINNLLFMDMSFTTDNSLPIGAEIISINSIQADNIITELLKRQIRDGNNETYPVWILSNYFRQYYSFIFGCPKTFTITYKSNEQTKTTTINALSKDSIAYYRQKKYPDKVFSFLPNDGLKLKIEIDKKYAVLTIKDFHTDILKKEYKQNFDKVIDSYFEQINKSKTENLILDLRNNQGGDIENGVYLLSYLLSKPFSVVQEYFCVNKKRLEKCNGSSLGTHTPKSNNFKGNLYVLINGGSFSNSGIVSSCLQANERATFIGQETGGNPNVIAGYIKDISLPNTKIQIQIPTKQFVITDKAKNNGRGLLPTHIIEPNLTDIINNTDTELEYTIKLINKKMTVSNKVLEKERLTRF